MLEKKPEIVYQRTETHYVIEEKRHGHDWYPYMTKVPEHMVGEQIEEFVQSLRRIDPKTEYRVLYRRVTTVDELEDY